ncbi:MAG: ribosome silencing factor [Gammaproteobacteria bacterium]|nr:ribosome silencing factor [Gammaproteobacteria bacterium]
MTSRKPARRAARPAASATKSAAASSAAAPQLPPQLKIVQDALEDMKAVDVRVLDVRGMTDISDWMVISSGNSDRHVRSIADRVVEQSKAAGVRPFGVEGANEGEWVLVDLPDVMVHVMLPRTREFYALEELWERTASKPAAGGAASKPRRPAAKPRAAAPPRGDDVAAPRPRRAAAPRRRPASAG